MKSIIDNTYYIKLPNESLNNPSCSKDRYYLLLFLLMRSYNQVDLPKGKFYSSSYDELSKRLGMSRRTFTSRLTELSKRGYLSRFKGGFRLSEYGDAIGQNFPLYSLFSKKNQKRKYYSFQKIKKETALELMKIDKEALYTYCLMYQGFNRFNFTNKNDKGSYTCNFAESVKDFQLSLRTIRQYSFNSLSVNKISKTIAKLERAKYLVVKRNKKLVMECDPSIRHWFDKSSKLVVEGNLVFDWDCNRYLFNYDLIAGEKHNLEKPSTKKKKTTTRKKLIFNDHVTDFFHDVDVKRELMMHGLINDMTPKISTNSYNRILNDIITKGLFFEFQLEELIQYISGKTDYIDYWKNGCHHSYVKDKFYFTFESNPPSTLKDFMKSIQERKEEKKLYNSRKTIILKSYSNDEIRAMLSSKNYYYPR